MKDRPLFLNVFFKVTIVIVLILRFRKAQLRRLLQFTIENYLLATRTGKLELHDSV